MRSTLSTRGAHASTNESGSLISGYLSGSVALLDNGRAFDSK